MARLQSGKTALALALITASIKAGNRITAYAAAKQAGITPGTLYRSAAYKALQTVYTIKDDKK